MQFRKVSDRREPPGLERTVFRKLPVWWLGGTVVPALVAALGRIYPPDGTEQSVAKHLYWVDALAIGAVMTVWTAVLTVAIGCWVVMVMKGPHYAADSYPLNDAPRPGTGNPDPD